MFLACLGEMLNFVLLTFVRHKKNVQSSFVAENPQ